MINANRPILNLDLDLLRTFVAVADLNTFAAAAAAVCRTQSAVSQQMQRLEQLVGKELFARHGRNKLLTEHGIQLLGYARKILRFNDEACTSLMFSNIQGVLTIGASDESADTILPFLLNRISAVYPKIALDVRVKRTPFILDMLENNEVDLAVSTYRPAPFESLTLRRSPTHWYCAAEYVLQKGDPLPLVLLEEPSALRDTVIHTLNAADIPWRMAYVASTLAAVKAAVKAGLGITARPVEMMSPDLRVLGQFDGLPPLADTEYVLCHNAQAENELAQVVFQAMENYHTPWQYSTVTPHEGGDPLIVEHDAE
ncbi:transcriptional regulator LrhA [Enterobacter kobei]|uniref:Transcriptional regulator LrhA n=2 Tax=Enterobacter kobei TaxID=208224 RepID=A0ACC8S2P6_9ENTR|nr:transcriptional regulator LrhA [Enterobacter kobei]OLR17783.1 transcriptional regulator LrhA [Enterobacter kobei]BCU54753.1 putative HTH-type transcriptional regulator LrhA [Enterobacter kobei]SIR70086.1 DNA-binding transcriptional regulator, LysR family [Enterobacter kobei]